MSDQQLPPAAALITHPVAEFDSWKVGFDQHETARRGATALGHHLNQAEGDPNLVTIYLAVADLDKAKAFAESDDLKATMQQVGVTGAPEITWVTPIRESIVWDRQLPAFLLKHRVADFDTWLQGYDAAAALQKSKGIIGHAANRSIDDPSMAIIYHQAESFDTLRAFLGDPDLQAAMSAAGVTSAPEVSFHIGGWAKRYE
jgi:hypothetical protein